MQVGSLEIQMQADLARLSKDMNEARGIVGDTADRISDAMDLVKRAFAAISASLLLRELADMTDRFTSLSGRMELAIGSAGAAARQIDILTAAANRHQVPMEEVTKLYLGVQRSADSLGASQQQLTKFTEGVSAGLRVSGSTSQSAAGSLQQLTQMMGGTNVQAEEFNSLIDGMPEVLRTVAANLGKTGISMGELREMVVKGKLSSAEFFQAFLKGSDDLIEKSKLLPPTIGGAFTELSNNIFVMVGKIDKEVGASGTIARGIKAFAESIPSLLDPILKLTAAIEPAIKIAAAYFAIFVGLPAIMTAAVGAFNVFALAVYNGTTIAGVFTAISTAAGGLLATLSPLAIAAGVVFAAFAAWQIGQWIYDNFETGRIAIDNFTIAALEAWEHIKYYAQVAWAYISESFTEAFRIIKEFLGPTFVWMSGLFSSFQTVALEAWEYIKTAAGKAWAWVSAELGNAFSAIRESFATVLDWIGKGLSALGNSMGEKLTTFAASIRSTSTETGAYELRVTALDAELAKNIATVRDHAVQLTKQREAHFAVGGAVLDQTDKLGGLSGATGKLSKEQEKAEEIYRKLKETILDKTGAMRAEFDQGAKLTAGQELELKIMQDINSGKLKLTDARRREIEELLREMLQTEKLNIARKAEIELAKQRNKEFDEAWEAMEKARLGTEGQIKTARTMLEQLEYETAALKMTTLERAISGAERELERQGIVRGTLAYDAYIDKIRNAVVNKDTVTQSVAAAKAIGDEWDKLQDQIGQSLSDSLFRAWESGGNFFSSAWEGIKNTIKTTVLVPFIKDTTKEFLGLFLGTKGTIEQSPITPLIKNTLTKVWDWFTGAKSDIESTPIDPQFSTLGFSGWLDFIVKGFDSVLKWFGSSWSGVFDSLSTGWSAIFGEGTGSWLSSIGSLASVANGGAGGGGAVGSLASTGSTLYNAYTGQGVAGAVVNYLTGGTGGLAALFASAQGTSAIGAAAGSAVGNAALIESTLGTVGYGVSGAAANAAAAATSEYAAMVAAQEYATAAAGLATPTAGTGTAAAGGGLPAGAMTGLGVVAAAYALMDMYDKKISDVVINGFASTNANYNAGAYSVGPEYDHGTGQLIANGYDPKNVYLQDNHGANDATAQQILSALTDQYGKLNTLLGGAANALTGSVYFASNLKNQDWSNMLALDAQLNGVDIYSRNDRKTGGGTIDDILGDKTVLEAAVNKATMEALLRALQASDYGDELNAKFDAIGLGGTGAELQAQITAIVEAETANARKTPSAAEASQQAALDQAVAELRALQAQGTTKAADDRTGQAAVVAAMNRVYALLDKISQGGDAMRTVPA